MKIRILVCIIFLTGMQSSCKLVNTYIFKLTSTPIINNEPELKITTSTGYLLLPLQKLNDKEREILRGIRPFQCLAIRTSEPFNMNKREVRFTDFQIKKLLESDAECRKIKVTTRIYGS